MPSYVELVLKDLKAQTDFFLDNCQNLSMNLCHLKADEVIGKNISVAEVMLSPSAIRDNVPQHHQSHIYGDIGKIGDFGDIGDISDIGKRD